MCASNCWMHDTTACSRRQFYVDGHARSSPGTSTHRGCYVLWHDDCAVSAQTRTRFGGLPKAYPGYGTYGKVKVMAAGSIIGWLVLGLIVGAIAGALSPGRTPGGFIGTIVIGIVGAFLGGWL